MTDRLDDGAGKKVKVTVVDRRHHAAADAPAGASERTPYPSVVAEFEQRVKRAEARAREAIARAEAECDAVRERLTRDVDRRVNEGRSRLLKSMLEVVDSLDRAAQAARAESASVAEGIDLIRRQGLSILAGEGVEPIETVGLPFDPSTSEAVAVEPVDRDRDNLVIAEIVRGYRLDDTVLRAAQVRVGKASGGEAGGSPAGDTGASA